MLLFLITLGIGIVFPQNSADLNIASIPQPAEEEFQPATDLVSPWRSSGCNLMGMEFKEPNCYHVKNDMWRISDMLTLYNQDGTVWYRFSLAPQKSDYFLKNPKPGFLPFATPFSPEPSVVLLRMVSESPNWYEVEVNEQTRATKFVSKNDPMWGTTKWSYWLYESVILKLDGTQYLRDKPNGEVIAESANVQFDKVKFLKQNGDWAFVHEFAKPNGYHGWIRWRKGRDIMVGCLYNNNKVPETKATADN